MREVTPEQQDAFDRAESAYESAPEFRDPYTIDDKEPRGALAGTDPGL